MKKIVSAVLLSWIVLTSCEQNTGTLSFDKAAFDRERAAWEASAITDYQFTTSYGNSAIFSGKGVQITVRENSEPVIEMLNEWALENMPKEYWGLYYWDAATISAVYTKIAQSYTSAQYKVKNEGYAVLIDVTYNTQYHYPEYVYYSEGLPGKNQDGGGWHSLRIKDFTPLPPGE
ncbi:hypothetical protein AGMMS50267_01190 [Spirochaetia bacterium]|nr:hypothetical protein AGMMS50267_01190 [Spirochaetia bacterium]